ncbi:Fc receptor-like protein 4 isoform X4 [Notamacropus eugenii]|uniref:Fc receptor-like protein 4 isoform X4 n=1 Tax=Notamacropus eugenii TaxID=9315 RepID=UPI003B66D0F3
MLLWALLLMLGLESRQASITKKAMVHLSPPWTTIFKGEKVTLTCHGFNSSKPGTTWWYKNQQLQEVSSTNSIETNQTGKYSCRTLNSALSDPVNLVVSSDKLILQTPYSIFEGETLVLRCRGYNDQTVRNVTYYKNGHVSSFFLIHSDFSIPRVGLSYSGNYHCTGVLRHLFWLSKKSSRAVELQVQELFPPPKLKTTTSQPTEGNPVTLNCETQLSPRRSNMELHFSFFRDDRVIASGWKKSQVLQIPAIWKEDSGLYWCEAKAMTQNIRKQSNYVKISVKSRSLFSQVNSSKKIGHLALGLIVTQFILVGLSASTLLFFFGPWSKPAVWRMDRSGERLEARRSIKKSSMQYRY